VGSLLTLLALTAPAAAEAGLPPVAIQGDAIPTALTGAPGDPARGRAIVADRTKGLCLLCHAAPIPEERFQGDIGPGLAGVGARLSPAQLRLRLVDGRALNPDTIMPSYYRIDPGPRVGAGFAGKPVLDAQGIEDVVAYLATLRETEEGQRP
jgi:sulfur-oxidizing protein SoxX